MLPPLPRCSSWVSSSLISPRRISLPRFHCRVGLHIDLFEVCSAFTHVAACTLAQSPYFVTAIRRLQTFRLLHACSGCFRRERIAGWALHPLKSAALSRRTWHAVIRSYQNMAERFDIGTIALVGSGNISRSQSSHCLRSSATRSGCFFERSPRSRGSYSISNRYSSSATFRYFQPPRRTARW